MRMSDLGVVALAALFPLAAITIGSVAPAPAATADEKCRALKLKAAASYMNCRLRAVSKAITRGTGPDFTKCALKHAKIWGKAEAKNSCPPTDITTELHTATTSSRFVAEPYVDPDLPEGSPPFACGVTFPVCGGDCPGANLLCARRYRCADGLTGVCASDADCPAGVACLEDACECVSASSAKRVFLSSTRTSNLFGVLGADERCNNEAAERGLGGTWMAWISGADPDAILSPDTRFTKSAAPYVRLDNEIVAHSWADLTDGNLENAINVLSDGSVAMLPTGTMTNTKPDGTIKYTDPGKSCQSWNSTSASFTFTSGGLHTSSAWTDATSPPLVGWPCNITTYAPAIAARLYCFEQ